jgi:hypothetical protein
MEALELACCPCSINRPTARPTLTASPIRSAIPQQDVADAVTLSNPLSLMVRLVQSLSKAEWKLSAGDLISVAGDR